MSNTYKGELLRAIIDQVVGASTLDDQTVRALVTRFRTEFPNDDELAGQAVEAGLDELQAVERVFLAAARNGSGSPTVKAALAGLAPYGASAEPAGRLAAEAGDWARARTAWEAERVSAGAPLTTVLPAEGARPIDRLPAGNEWDVFVGRVPARIAPFAHARNEQSRYLALVRPADSLLTAVPVLPPLPFPEQLDTAVQMVLNSPIGVLGLTGLSDEAVVLLTLLRWVARLLPAQGPGIARLYLVRGLESGAVTNLVISPDGLATRVGPLAVTGPFEVRPDAEVAAAFTAIARAWADVSPSGLARIAASGLACDCLSDADAGRLARVADALDRGEPPLPSDWAGVVTEAGTGGAGVVAVLACRVGELCRANLDVWERYRAEAYRYLDGKAVRLDAIARKAAWLRDYAPADASDLSLRLRLAWLTTQLAIGNLTGETESEDVSELCRLCDILFDEDAPLVCQAELRLAVRETNRFAFDRASEMLARWAEYPPACPGLQLWGRVQSSLGQHAAFRGEYARAAVYFEDALAAFDRLSDPDAAAADRTQTATYRALAAIDDPNTPAEAARAAVEQVVDLSRAGMWEMASTATPSEQYRHHLLLRYLVYRGTPEEQRAYLAARRGWRSRPGHPWQLILAYRAILVDQEGDRAEARGLLQDARLAIAGIDPGPTLQVIEVALSAIAIGWGEETAPGPALERLQVELPAAGRWLGVIHDSVTGCKVVDPAEFLRQALPFNFR